MSSPATEPGCPFQTLSRFLNSRVSFDPGRAWRRKWTCPAARFGEAREARLGWRPLAAVAVEGDAADSLFRLIEVLEDHDDVQSVTGNFTVSAETLAKLSG